MPLWLVLTTILSYHVPRYEAVNCDSLITDWNERMGTVELWYAPRWGPWSLIRQKDVTGLEGQLDTLWVPDDTLATVYLIAVDQAGNRSCPGNPITVAGRVGVPYMPQDRTSREIWFDVLGRRLSGRPGRSGVFWRVRSNGTRQLVRIR